MKKTLLEHLNNFIQISLSLSIMLISILLLEYEISKFQSPDASWIPTPAAFNVITSGMALFLGTINTSMHILIYKNGLENRQWIWWTILLGLILVGGIYNILGKTAFLTILFPNLSIP